MMRRAIGWAPTLGLFCTVLNLASPAHAEDASAAETAAARTLAVDGLKLAQANNCAEAVPKLERAEKLYHSTVVASRLGECYVALGRLVEGTEVLRKSLREPLPAEPTPAHIKALDRAQKVLDAAKPRIAGLTIKVVAVEGMIVKVDGNAVPSALVDTEMPTDPGEHRIEVTAPGFLKSGTHVGVGEGEKKTITLTLSRDPNAAVAQAPAASAAAASSAPTATSAPEPNQRRDEGAAVRPQPPKPAPNRTAAYVAYGIGGAALAAGGVLGYLTMKRHEELQGSCPADVCSSQRQADLDSAKQLGNFSTIGVGVGAAGIALGTILLFTNGSSGDADHASKPSPTRFAGLSKPRVAVGPTQIQLGADF
jgi:hypothetical protein